MMKCLAYKRSYQKANKAAASAFIDDLIAWASFATAEILRKYIHWGEKRTHTYLASVNQNILMTNSPLFDMDSFNCLLNYEYECKLKTSIVNEEASVYAEAMSMNRQQVLDWVINIYCYTFFHDYNWSPATVQRYLNYLDHYIPELLGGRTAVLEMQDRLVRDLGVKYRLIMTNHGRKAYEDRK